MYTNNRQAGFTLIEVMISMLIFAIISLISYNAVQTYSAHQKLSFEHFSKVHALQKMTVFIGRDMNQVFNQNITLQGNVLAFETLQNDVVLKVRYLVENDNLVREETLGDESIVLVLVKNIKKFKLRLRNSKNKLLSTHSKKNQHITRLELSFESDYWGEIQQLAVVGE